MLSFESQTPTLGDGQMSFTKIEVSLWIKEHDPFIFFITYDHWSVAVLTVTVHSSFFPTFDFFLKICCFLHWIQSVNPHFFVSLYYNGSPYICDS